MRELIAWLAVAGLVWCSPAPALPAQTTSAVEGRVVDAAGRPLRDLTVEIFAAEGGQPVGAALQAGVTDAQGTWAFSGLTPGEYVVQAVSGASSFGVPVTVGAAPLLGVQMLAPSAFVAAASGAAAAAGIGALQGGLLAAGAVGAAAATAVVVFSDDQS